MIITIDGPAGAGKSTVARCLAERLGYELLDTGALYRMVTLAATRAGILPEDEARMRSLLESIDFDWRDGSAMLDREDVSLEIRNPEITRQIQGYADSPLVRRMVTERTRTIARGRNIVTEGRDQGSVVFPDAEIKFFLTASAEIRARRRFEELTSRGQEVSFDDVLADQIRRDEQDASRPVGALVQPPGAIVIDSTELSTEQAVDAMERHVRRNFGAAGVC